VSIAPAKSPRSHQLATGSNLNRSGTTSQVQYDQTNSEAQLQPGPSPSSQALPAAQPGQATSVPLPEKDADRFGEVNKHTKGTEFYGPTGVFSFLSRLCKKAQLQTRGDVQYRSSADRHLSGLSIVSHLHSPDYQATCTLTGDALSKDVEARSRPDVESSTLTPSLVSVTEAERECIRLYFQNLHHIHPVLDQSTFLSQCNEQVWNQETLPRARAATTDPIFLALYNAVLALGAITAGEESLLAQPESDTRSAATYRPLQIAGIYFGRAKTHLGDIFEAASIQSTQTLFLMVRSH